MSLEYEPSSETLHSEAVERGAPEMMADRFTSHPQEMMAYRFTPNPQEMMAHRFTPHPQP